MESKSKMEKLTTKALIEQDEKAGLIAVASTAVEDRHGEVVEVEGWDLKSYKKNPVIQWAHDHSIPAIGTAKNLKVEKGAKGSRLIFQPVFHDKTEFAKALKQLVEDGIIKAFSVGFRPLEVDGNKYTKQELLEISLVNVPANQEALMLAYKSLDKAGFKKDVIDKVVDEEGLKEMLTEKDFDERIKRLEKELEQVKEDNVYLAKGLKNLKPQVDKKQALITRRTALKAISRAADSVLEKNGDARVKVIKRATDKLLADNKQELQNNGTNKRT